MISLRDHITFCLFCVKLFIHSKKLSSQWAAKTFSSVNQAQKFEKFLSPPKKSRSQKCPTVSSKWVETSSKRVVASPPSPKSVKNSLHSTKCPFPKEISSNFTNNASVVTTRFSHSASSCLQPLSRSSHAARSTWISHRRKLTSNFKRIATCPRWSQSDQFRRKNLPWSIFSFVIHI